MCGIYGAVGSNIKKYSKELNSFDKLLHHRGPDGNGIYKSNNILLGHRRLNIIDLTSKANQPMRSKNNNNIISFNGEIYNYKQILNKLNLDPNKFGDTRALIELFSRKGILALNELRGMFAIAIYDIKTKKTYLIRDRFGIKQLYYTFFDNCIFFASEIKPLLQLPIKRLPNDKIVQEYINHTLLDHSDETFFKNIYKLEAGHYLEIENACKTFKKKKWYSLIDRIKNKKTFNNIEDFKQKMLESLELHNISDVDIGIALSGGLDSKILLDYFEKKKRDLKTNTFSFIFKNKKYSEEKGIENNIGNHKVNKNFLNLDENILQEIDKNILLQEEPFGGAATIAMTKIFEMSQKKKIKVILTGEGADDYLSGSRREIVYYLKELKENHNELYKKEAADFCKINKITIYNLEKMIQLINNGKTLSPDGTVAIEDKLLKNYSAKKLKYMTFKESLFNRFMIAKLPKNLRFVDKSSMSASVEARVPYLDHKLVESGFSLNSENLIRNGNGKHVLRNFFSNEYFINSKIPVQIPQTLWLKKEKNIKYLIKNFKNNREIIEKYVKVNELINFLKSSKYKKINNSNFIWQILMITSWYNHFIK
tara:strand:+ start:251 stop:2035 length:1785 start_codon:yes stop_codon:yes gene_type:complete